MPTLEIPREEWTTFFDSFSNRHRGWLVTLEILDPEIGDQTEAHDLPLEGITAELNQRGADQIEVVVGSKADSHLSDTIADPWEVWLKSTDEGADDVLEIKAKNKTTLIRFKSTILPEMVDAL
jgi:hypothetical protein